MSDIRSAVQELAVADAGSRYLDEVVAEVLGWNRVATTFVDDDGREQGRTIWQDSNGATREHVANYTTDLQTAYEFARSLDLSGCGGCSWEEGRAGAKIGMSANAISAATPALALCIATLLNLLIQQISAADK